MQPVGSACMHRSIHYRNVISVREGRPRFENDEEHMTDMACWQTICSCNRMAARKCVH